MRLIDADTLIEDINTWTMQCDDIESIVMLQTVVDKIENQPTAYDVEKAVAELEHEADLQEYLLQDSYNRYNVAQANIHRYAEQCYRNKAIDIVRKGGVE